ncbi:MAG: hypothetical protein LUD16_05160 [Lachnospiraceae bacterium]|nr:hypothetical protein [Lachnospiraceae bacterium]
MKKRTYLIIGAMCAGLMLAGMSAAADEDGTEEAVAEESGSEASAENASEEDNLLQELEEPNLLDELVARYGRVSFKNTYYWVDGTESEWTVYQDDTWYVDENYQNLLIDEDGDVYGIDYEENNKGFRFLFVGKTGYQSLKDEMEVVSLFAYNEDEQILSREDKDGMIYLETIAYYTDDYTADELSDYGYYANAYEYEVADYVIDAETYEILEMKVYVGYEDEVTLFLESYLDREPEQYTRDEELCDSIFGDDYSLSIATDGGTDEEVIYTQSVKEGCMIWIWRGYELEDNYYYVDPECTEYAEEITDYDIVYVKNKNSLSAYAGENSETETEAVTETAENSETETEAVTEAAENSETETEAAAEAAENSEMETEAATEAGAGSAIEFEEMTVIDDQDCIVKITSIEPDNRFGYSLKAYFENNSELDYYFLITDASLNGVMCDPFFGVEVAAGETAESEILFYSFFDFTEDIGEISDIEFTIDVYDNDTWDDITSETVSIYPEGEENAAQFERETLDTDTILLDNEYATVIVTECGYDKDGYTLKLFLVNKTDERVTFVSQDAFVNGAELDPYWGAELMAGMCAFSSMTWYEEDLYENSIEEVTDLEFSMALYDHETWSEYFNETITFEP